MALSTTDHTWTHADIPGVIEGETGTGKEVLAQALHECSPRAEGSFIVFDCTTVPSNLVESELFGHERGAFTGAIRERVTALLIALKRCLCHQSGNRAHTAGSGATGRCLTSFLLSCLALDSHAPTIGARVVGRTADCKPGRATPNAAAKRGVRPPRSTPESPVKAQWCSEPK